MACPFFWKRAVPGTISKTSLFGFLKCPLVISLALVNMFMVFFDKWTYLSGFCLWHNKMEMIQLSILRCLFGRLTDRF